MTVPILAARALSTLSVASRSKTMILRLLYAQGQSVPSITRRQRQASA
jgi:hypothetical protein